MRLRHHYIPLKNDKARYIINLKMKDIHEVSMEKQIEKVLKEKVDPVLAEHYGGAMLKKFEDGIAYVRLSLIHI